MAAKKTLRQREKELQALLATPAGREELRALRAKYQAADGQANSSSTSVSTFMRVHERVHGIIAGWLRVGVVSDARAYIVAQHAA